MLRVFLVLVMVCVFGDGSLSGRGLFCRDPETGQLHPVNSTWTATSFCGTYHCKIRRKNITSTEYAPMRQINITNIQLLGENATTVNIQKGKGIVKKEKVLKDTVSTDKKTIPYIIDSETLKEIPGIKLNDDIDEKNASDKDRYLSDKEIGSLTDILHTVKKGDLDAIVEMYNLAQHMFNELDETSTELILQEALSTAKTSEQQIVQSKLFKNSASYWYEPLSNTKTVADLAPPDITRNDISLEIPAIVISIKAPAANVTSKPTTKIIPPRILPKLPAAAPATPNMQERKDGFFRNPLSQNDFGKLPYYYPMSYFQRISSYKHDPKNLLLDYTRSQEHKLVPLLTTTPALIPSWISKFIPAMMKMPEFMPALAEAWIPEYIPKSRPVHTQAWNPARIPEPKPEHTQAQRIPSRKLVEIPTPIPVRIPTPIPVRIPTPIPVQIPTRMLNRIPAPVSVQVPPKATTTLPSPTPAPKSAHKPIKNKLIKTGTKYSKELRPLSFLPYPFTIIQQKKNWPLMQSLYSGTNFGQLKQRKTNEVSNIKTITREDIISNEIPSIKKRKNKQDNVVLMNPELENFQDLKVSASKKRENMVTSNKKEEHRAFERRKPAWQTDPIPEHIMNEVRANIQENHRGLIHTVPFRKKVKLERVGKLFKVDQVTRTKRAAEDTNETTEAMPLEPEIFELFIEKTTCDSDYSVPGFFRFGNLSEPFPECCPQRIPAR